MSASISFELAFGTSDPHGRIINDTLAALHDSDNATRTETAAGREEMSDGIQALCFLAGANSIFYGEKLLTTPNPDKDHDTRLFERLDLVRA